MGSKIGRNDPCWCGSQRKYKHCHNGSTDPHAATKAELFKEHRRSFRRPMCLVPKVHAPQCVRQIVSAHTVPRVYLTQIARAQHVYQIRFDAFAPQPLGVPFAPKLVGINEASTITGFCSSHDNALFAPLEKVSFSATSEQCFLLMYRAVTRELYQKLAALDSINARKRVFRERRIQLSGETQQMSAGYEAGTRKGLSEMRNQRNMLDRILLSRKFDLVRSYVVKLSEAPDAMCAGAHYPECVFEGDFLPNHFKLGQLRAPAPDLLSFSSVAGDGFGYVIFSWLEDSDTSCIPFIESLERVPESRISDAIVRFFAEFCENTYFRPGWWEALPADDRDALVMRMATGGSPIHGRRPDCLADDGRNLANWKVADRFRLHCPA
jgi:hypothetical protein